MATEELAVRAEAGDSDMLMCQTSEMINKYWLVMSPSGFGSRRAPTWREASFFFPVSGMETWVWLPPLVALVFSFFGAMVGISGAILLLPFQVSVLNFTSPSVSSTPPITRSSCNYPADTGTYARRYARALDFCG